VVLLHVQPDQGTALDVWKVDAIVVKNRNGPVGETALDYIRPILRFDQSAK
jgi:replicative DNA helicase